MPPRRSPIPRSKRWWSRRRPGPTTVGVREALERGRHVLRREAARRLPGRGRGARGARRAGAPRAARRPCVPLQSGGGARQGVPRRRRARPGPLRVLGAHEPRPGARRRERGLGSGGAGRRHPRRLAGSATRDRRRRAAARGSTPASRMRCSPPCAIPATSSPISTARGSIRTRPARSSSSASSRMLSYDDMNLAEPIRLYDKRVAEQRAQSPFVDTFAGFRSVRARRRRADPTRGAWASRCGRRASTSSTASRRASGPLTGGRLGARRGARARGDGALAPCRRPRGGGVSAERSPGRSRDAAPRDRGRGRGAASRGCVERRRSSSARRSRSSRTHSRASSAWGTASASAAAPTRSSWRCARSESGRGTR